MAKIRILIRNIRNMAEDYLKKETLGKIKSDEKILKWQLWQKTAKEAKICW